MWFSGQSRKVNWEPKTRFSWIDYIIDTQIGLIHANEEGIKKLSSEFEQICANWQSSELVHVRLLASIVGQIISLSTSCGCMTQIMTRYLHIIIILDARGTSKFVFVSFEGKKNFCSRKTIWEFWTALCFGHLRLFLPNSCFLMTHPRAARLLFRALVSCFTEIGH